MSFQIKDFRSIVTSMINVAKASGGPITDFSVGSVTRTLMEAPAAEMEELYLQMLLGLQDAIKTAVFSSFDFAALPAVSASGVVRFGVDASSSAVTIQAGTRVKSSSRSPEYLISADVTVPVGGTYADVLAYCETPGSSGNCGAESINTLVVGVNGVLSVINQSAFTNGADSESDDARKLRFIAWVSTLSRGTSSAVKYGATSGVVFGSLGDVIESVAYAEVVEPYLLNANEPVGLVYVYIHNGVGATSQALVDNVMLVLSGYRANDGTMVPGWKAAGVKVVVIAASDVAAPIAANITMLPGYEKSLAVSAATDAIKSYVSALGIGQPILRSEIISIIMGMNGVYNVSLASPAADYLLGISQKHIVGTVTIT